MSQLFKFLRWSQGSHIPCLTENVLPVFNSLDLWYTSGIRVTYVTVSNSRRGHCYPGLLPMRYLGVIGVPHHSVSRAEFNLVESFLLQADYIEHNLNQRLLYDSPWSRTHDR